jgi:eukaryotic-like serine/threonine-protein kinase
MPTPSRIFDLLEEALTTERLPEELCADCPELLEELRRRIELCTSLNNQIDDLFPSSTPSSACDEPTVIPRIDGYLITNVLGRGGTGIVYRAQQVSLDRDVAIKMLLTGRYSTKSELHRLSREARAIGRLRHPNIVQVYDVGTVGRQPYFTMELVDNGTLAKHLGGRPVEAATAAALTVTLAEAIDAAHGVGIVHRDLKPANILMAIDGSPKIADFGLARHFGDDSAMLTLSAHVGTPSYMAPEQVRGTRDATNPLVDIYALGAILYECLTGRPPFRGETSAQTQQQVLTLDPTALIPSPAIWRRFIVKKSSLPSVGNSSSDSSSRWRLGRPMLSRSRCSISVRHGTELFRGAAIGTTREGGTSSSQGIDRAGHAVLLQPHPANSRQRQSHGIAQRQTKVLTSRPEFR